MKQLRMRMFALILTLGILASLGASAFAEAAYPADQRYEKDPAQEKVYAVLVGSGSEEDCAALRDRMLAAGFDAYLYESGGSLSVRCGKFRSAEDAAACRAQIRESGEDVRAVIGLVWLPAEVIDAFEAGPQEQAPAETTAPKTRTTCSLQDTEGTQVYSVALSFSQDFAYADALCDKMEKAGFDAFILEENGGYRVMSGKFHDICNALLYRDCIWSNTDRTDTYIATVTVPEADIAAFTEDYETNGLPGKIKDNLEKPTGAFYREQNGTVCAWTVQFSAGTSFSGAERNRDAMTAMGYPAFVYECSRVYEIMTGAFYDKSAAEAYCQEIKDNTGEYDAYVTRAWLPAGIVK